MMALAGGDVFRLNVIIRLTFLLQINDLVAHTHHGQQLKGRAQPVTYAGSQQLRGGDIIELLETVLGAGTAGQGMDTNQGDQRPRSPPHEVDRVIMLTVFLHYESTKDPQWWRAIQGITRHGGQKPGRTYRPFGNQILQ